MLFDKWIRLRSFCFLFDIFDAGSSRCEISVKMVIFLGWHAAFVVAPWSITSFSVLGELIQQHVFGNSLRFVMVREVVKVGFLLPVFVFSAN